MNNNKNSVIAEILVNASVKTVGKREFLKAVEKVLGNKREKYTAITATLNFFIFLKLYIFFLF
jgi:hypothetical protein